MVVLVVDFGEATVSRVMIIWPVCGMDGVGLTIGLRDAQRCQPLVWLLNMIGQRISRSCWNRVTRAHLRQY